MKCSTCRAQLGDFLDESLSASDRQKVAAHLQTCPECQNQLQILSDDKKLARTALSELKPVAAPPELRLKVRAAIQDERERPSRRLPAWPRLAPSLIWSGPVCLAAVALLLLAKPPTPTPRSVTESSPQASFDSQSSENAAPPQVPAAPSGARPPIASKKRPPTQASSQNRAATQPAPAPTSSRLSKTPRVSPLENPKTAAPPVTLNGNSPDREAARAQMQETTPRNVTPQNATPQVATPKSVTPRNVTPQSATPKSLTPQNATSGADSDSETRVPLPPPGLNAKRRDSSAADSAADSASSHALPPITARTAPQPKTRPAPAAPPRLAQAAPATTRFSLEITPLSAPTAPTVRPEALAPNLNDASEALRAPAPVQAPAPAPVPAPQRRLVPPDTTRAADDSNAANASRSRAGAFENRGAGGRGGSPGGFSGGRGGGESASPGTTGRPDAVAKAVSPALAQRWNFKIAASRDLQNAQVRLILPPTLSFAGVADVASRAVWRGDLAAGKPAIIEVSLLGARGGEKISVVLEQIGDKEQSKLLETQTVALPAP